MCRGVWLEALALYQETGSAQGREWWLALLAVWPRPSWGLCSSPASHSGTPGYTTALLGACCFVDGLPLWVTAVVLKVSCTLFHCRVQYCHCSVAVLSLYTTALVGALLTAGLPLRDPWYTTALLGPDCLIDGLPLWVTAVVAQGELSEMSLYTVQHSIVTVSSLYCHCIVTDTTALLGPSASSAGCPCGSLACTALYCTVLYCNVK